MSARFTTIDPIRDGSNWFSYVVNDPVNYCDPFGLSSTDSSWWSNVKSTVKGWGESIKSDLIQTWNDIKGVVSTAIVDAKTAVSTFISNAQATISGWSGQTTEASRDASSKKNKTNSTNAKPDTNRTSKKGVDINLFPKDEKIYKNANKVKNPLNDDTFIVGGHGDEWNIYDYNRHYNPDELAELIKSDKNYRDGMTVILYSCSTGDSTANGEYVYAQRLADELGPGAKVIAPSDTMDIFKRNDKYIWRQIKD